MASMTKTLVKIVRALAVGDKPKPRPRVKQKQGKTLYHWHMTPNKTQYAMVKIGFNSRTRKNVYQCPFCGGKAERPY